MKKINLTIILCLVLSVSFAQTKRFTKLREFYPMITNVDSLEKEVYSYKNEPLRYLQGLIRLEFSRKKSDKFGKDANNILSLSKQLKYPLGVAVYNYIQGEVLRTEDETKSFVHFQNALSYFEKSRDTTGIIYCLSKLYVLNINELLEKNGDTKTAKQQLEYLVAIGEQSSCINDKVFVRIFLQNNRHLFDKTLSYEQQMTFFNDLEALIQKLHPSEKQLYFVAFYEAKGLYFDLLGKHKEALLYNKASLDYCNYCSPNERAVANNNIAYSYAMLNQFDKAEKYYKENIEIFESYKYKPTLVFIEAYDSYAVIQFEKGDYKKAWKYRNIKDSLQQVYNDNAKNKEFINLQTKYETEKKESTIKTLELEKQAAESEKWGLIIGLFLLVGIVGIVSFLLLKLRKTNANLLTLQKARDKLYTIIAHDLRSPLNTYQRYSEIVGYLIKNKQFDRLDTTLKQIDEIGLHLASLLNNLLQWSLAQQKQVNFTPKNIHVRQFFDDLLPIYRDMAKLKSVVLIEDFADDDISTDPNTLSLIVRNLLDNAIKYTPEGEKVKIKTFSNEKEFILSLSNRGDIMTKAQKTKIKTLFETTQDFDFGEEGIGVGLILVKQYAKTNHAKVSFENDDDGHITFKVVVPRMAAA